MKAGYCWFCDAAAPSDPCPNCGKALYRSPQGEIPPVSSIPAPAISEIGRRPNLRMLILVLAVAILLLVIAVVAASSEGIS